MQEKFSQLRRKRGWMNLKVTKVIKETHDTDTFIMVDADDGGRVFDYFAGQYLTFRFDGVAEKPLVRSYTMSSSPNQPDFCAFTVKRVPGGVLSNWLCDQVKEGTILKARGPIGRFIYEPEVDAPHLIMIAGGSGVTPFVSMLREYGEKLGQDDSPKKMSLLVSYRSKEDLICWPELQQAKALPGVRIVTTLTRENLPDEGFLHGRINDQMLADFIDGQYQHATFMTCGPEAIMNLAAAHVRDRGVDEKHIKMESFES